MDDLIPRAESERMLAEATAKVRLEYVQQIEQLKSALDAAKSQIAVLLSRIFGSKTERSAVILPAEGQQLINPEWHSDALQEKSSQQENANDKKDETSASTRKQTPRDHRGVAQRHPQLEIQVAESPVPPEIKEQVEAGSVRVERTGRYEDTLVVPPEKPFIRRVFEVQVVSTGNDQVQMQLPMPAQIVPGGVLADETIHRLVIAKFLDAIPFFRTLTSWERLGLDVAKQTVNDAFNSWATIFEPLANLIIAQVMRSPVVHSDDSWVRVQAPGTCITGHIWTLVGDGQVGYRFTPDWTHDRAAEIIPPDFTGYLVRDEWPGWKTLTQIRQAGCNAHARRPFARILDAGGKNHPPDPDAKIIVDLYADVYRLEHQAKDGPPAGILDRRREIRREQTTPIMQRILTEAKRIAVKFHRNHPLADGSRYIIDYFPALTKFLVNPELPPDNNAAEGALRINALIRKNSLFFGTEEAGERGAVAMTLLHSCRLAGIEPFGYLAKVTPTLILHHRGRPQDLPALLPAVYKDSSASGCRL